MATLLADPPKLFDAFAARLKLLTAPADGVLNASVVRFVFDVLFLNEIWYDAINKKSCVKSSAHFSTGAIKIVISTDQARIGGGGGLLLRPCGRLSLAITGVTGDLFCASFASVGGFGGATVGRGGAANGN